MLAAPTSVASKQPRRLQLSQDQDQLKDQRHLAQQLSRFCTAIGLQTPPPQPANALPEPSPTNDTQLSQADPPSANDTQPVLVEPAPTIPANAIHPPSTQAGLQTNPPQPTSMLPELLSASDDALSQAEPNVSPTPSTPSENGGDRKSLAANANPLLSVNDTQPANMLPELLSVGVNALSPTEPPSANDTQPVLAEPPHATNAEPIGAQPLMELKQHSQHILANAVAQTTTERSLRSEPAEPQPLAGPAVPALPPEPIKPMVAVPPRAANAKPLAAIENQPAFADISDVWSASLHQGYPDCDEENFSACSQFLLSSIPVLAATCTPASVATSSASNASDDPVCLKATPTTTKLREYA